MKLYVQLSILSNYVQSCKDFTAKMPKKATHETLQVKKKVDDFFYHMGFKKNYAMCTETCGRPYLKFESEADLSVDFNISHSKEGLAIFVVACEDGDFRIGCDLECIHPRKNYLEIAQEVFFPQEVQWIVDGSGEEGLERFYRVWTVKEAWLKVQGKSVFDMAETPVFTPFVQIPYEPIHITQFFVSSVKANNYVVTAVSPFPLPESVLVLEEGWSFIRKAKMYAAERPVNTVSPKI